MLCHTTLWTVIGTLAPFDHLVLYKWLNNSQHNDGWCYGAPNAYRYTSLHLKTLEGHLLLSTLRGNCKGAAEMLAEQNWWDLPNLIEAVCAAGFGCLNAKDLMFFKYFACSSSTFVAGNSGLASLDWTHEGLCFCIHFPNMVIWCIEVWHTNIISKDSCTCGGKYVLEAELWMFCCAWKWVVESMVT